MFKKNKTKVIIAVLLVFVAGVAVYRYLGRSTTEPTTFVANKQNEKQRPETSEELTNQNSDTTAIQESPQDQIETQSLTPPPTPPVSTGQFTDEDDIQGSDVQVFKVTYNGSGFIPASLDIFLGDIVVFENKSTSPFWPASDPYPSHSNYPEFDAKGAYSIAEKFTFKFTRKGKHAYQDDFNLSAKGIINVK